MCEKESTREIMIKVCQGSYEATCSGLSFNIPEASYTQKRKSTHHNYFNYLTLILRYFTQYAVIANISHGHDDKL